jgi:hypothetical protein
LIILPEYSFPYVVDNVSGPVVPKFSWFYDVSLNDFVLRPINLLEETFGTSVRVRINNFDFNVPESWNLMIMDEETKMIDTVPITQCASSNYLALLMHPETHDYHTSPVTLLDLIVKDTCTYVMIPRMHMMLHPVGQLSASNFSKNSKKVDLSYCCLLSPQDLGKYMDNMTAMEVIL